MNDLEQLRAFAQDIMEYWPESDYIDIFELQDMAVKHGLLKEEIRYEDCSVEGVSSCSCATYFTSKVFEAGVQCFRKTKLLKGE